MVSHSCDIGAMMAVDKIQKDISAFTITPRMQQTTTWQTSDGLAFDLKKDADKHDKKVVALSEFFTHFSQEKGNLRLGNQLLNKILCPLPHEKDYTFEDCFWLKFNINEDEGGEDTKILRKFCSSFYKATASARLTSEDNFVPQASQAWVYIMVINTNSQSANRWYWISLETMRKRVKIMENCFPDNDNCLTPLRSEESLLDLD